MYLEKSTLQEVKIFFVKKKNSQKKIPNAMEISMEFGVLNLELKSMINF